MLCFHVGYRLNKKRSFLFCALLFLVSTLSDYSLGSNVLMLDKKTNIFPSNDPFSGSKILSISEAFKITRFPEDEIIFILGESIYLYDSKIRIEDLAGNEILAMRSPGVFFEDPLMGKTKIHVNKLLLKIENPPGTLVLSYQGCSLDGFCYPPQKDVLYATQSSVIKF